MCTYKHYLDSCVNMNYKYASYDTFVHTLTHNLWSLYVATPLWVKCEDETHTPKSGNLESSGTPENSELEFRGQNTSYWGFLYTIASDLIPIRGLSKKLWMPKVPGVQNGTVSGLLLGSLGKKCHSDVASAESCRKYYKGEGGGFPQVRTVVSQVSPRLPVACPNTKRVQNEFKPTCWLVWMQDRITK
jgi:hypothetical protein